jgi:hypothetical protein
MVHPFLVNVASKTNVPVPLIYYWHEKKTQETHDEFFRFIEKHFSIIETKGFLVTDCEDGFRNAIREQLPTVLLIRCWNHLYASIERWLTQNGRKANDIAMYLESTQELFLQDTKEKFDAMLLKKKNGFTTSLDHVVPAWDLDYANYFTKNVLIDKEAIAKYSVLKWLGEYFTNKSGITTQSCRQHEANEARPHQDS